MMSFRRATDATHIAQLLGRMIRTPKQMHIDVDDTLNDVHLYLPYFDVGTVEKIVEALQEAEGGELPTEIDHEEIGSGHREVLVLTPPTPKVVPVPSQTPAPSSPEPASQDSTVPTSNGDEYQPTITAPVSAVAQQTAAPSTMANATGGEQQNASSTDANPPAGLSPFKLDGDQAPTTSKAPLWPDMFDRKGIVKFINDQHLLNYDIRSVVISDYFKSLCKLAHFMTQAHLNPNAVSEVTQDIVDLIHEYAVELKNNGTYNDLVTQVMQFKLITKVFDPFGQPLSVAGDGDLFSTTDTDIDRQLRMAENKLGNEGVANAYGAKYGDDDDPLAYKVEVILFTADEPCWQKLLAYAKEKFHEYRDQVRPLVAGLTENWRHQYDRIASDADIVSPHNFTLPETICVTRESENTGISYSNHLFCNEEGRARFILNSWEIGVLQEEFERPDFVCWLRNITRASWALQLPYDVGDKKKPFFPDFFIVRKDPMNPEGYLIDILEPHGPQYDDNVPKAKALADYAERNPSIRRVEMIREMNGAVPGQKVYKRLDMAKSAIRTKVKGIHSSAELDQLFVES